MKVLALDPGYDRLGVAVLEMQNGKEHLIYSTCVMTDKADTLPNRLFTIGTRVTELLDEHTPDAIGVETLFFNKNIKTGIGVAQARGIILFLARQRGCTVYEFGPQEIKVAVTGYGKSDKRAVIDMVKRLVPNVPHTAHDDEYDAIAVGITTLAHHGR
ncbi:MAG: crossover junction endodeoxyribonuclease RuvC [Candidatus Kaiserbacteria bacterium]|nr:crossover junction endodeoxyribonuclease RuvC [Candidatus Kaiserbacteria bacterium]